MHDQLASVSAACLNCGAALGGPYCAHCGQKAAEPTPTLHDLLHDALEEFLHFDGKIVQTLRTLILQPGQLTVDLVAGRRARYIAPLRLYLTCSVIYFLIAAAGPTRTVVIQVAPSKTSGVHAQNAAPLRLSEEDRALLRQELEKKASPWVRPLVMRAIDDPDGLQRDIFNAWPKALFVLLPVFALIVALFYRHHPFVEHMYFALHIHAFAFLSMTLAPLVALAHIRWLSVAVGVVVVVWLPVYVHLAFRRVYGETHVATIVKETGVGILYMLVSIPAIFVAALWVASHHH